MKQKQYLILGIIVVAIVVVVILVVRYIPTKISVITQNPILINKNREPSGEASSPMDIELSVTRFSNDKISEITMKVGKRIGFKTESFQANNTRAEIQLPEGLELIDGNPIWEGDLTGDEVAEFKIKVKAFKNGEWTVKANAICEKSPGYKFGDSERFYILVKDNEVLMSDRSFNQVNPNEMAERVE